MGRPVLFAANWKMQVAPGEARLYLERFLSLDAPRAGRTLAFFPPAVSLEAVADAIRGHDHIVAGAQDVHWEPKGAFTGAVSVPLVRAAGAAAVLIGHSERRHVFGETDAETARKVAAVLGGGLQAMLCVGETLAQREAGETEAVCARQLQAALAGVAPTADLVIAYEPVWAIGTGRTASPEQAQEVHAMIRAKVTERDATIGGSVRILYGGSVKASNAQELFAMPDIDGGLVGGASLKADEFARICAGAG